MERSPLRYRLDQFWQQAVRLLRFAYQPIVNVHTGAVLGFEALLRGVTDAGFASIEQVFDSAFDQGCLYEVDLTLRFKAIEGFAAFDCRDRAKLFYNLDNRMFDLPTSPDPDTAVMMSHFHLPNSALCLEISERHHLSDEQRENGLIQFYRRHGFRIALDDFGSGYSGLQLLYHAQPDIIKIDRFLIAGVDRDPKKRVFVSNIVNMAHIMGITVIAEGIETPEEFRLCRDVGSDYAQGYLIDRPSEDCSTFCDTYELVTRMGETDRRNRTDNQDIILRKMEMVQPIVVTDPITDVLDRFRRNQSRTFFPVVTEQGEAIGVLRETDLKRYVYSPFGFSLLQNRNYPKDVISFTSRAPVLDVHSRMEKVVEAYAINEDAEAVILTENGRYCGLLQSRALIEALNERRVEQARDQNALSGLPGNHTITEYLSHALARTEGDGYSFAYVDFDHFKVFNDTYGFRLGDRAIMVFADALRELAVRSSIFTGHIGGDDFFLAVALENLDCVSFHDEIQTLLLRFRETALGLYSAEDRNRGYVTGKSRDGRRKRFPLLSASAAALTINGPIAGGVSAEQVSEQIATLKIQAKNRADGFAYAYLDLSETGHEVLAASPCASADELVRPLNGQPNRPEM